MKNLIFSTLFALITTLGFSQLTYMPDDVFETLVETSSGVPFNNDNYVSTSLIINWGVINIHPQILDITGIEDFDNLTCIYFASSNISIIDLSNCSNLNWGIIVDIQDCPSLTTVILPPNEIAFSIILCPNLSEVTFQNSNVIRDINPNNINGGSVIGSNTSLICLDMSNILDVILGSRLSIGGNNNLSGLKLNNGNCIKWGRVSTNQNPSLLCVQVDDPAFCYNAQSLGTWEWNCFTNPPCPFLYSTTCPNCIAEVDELPTISINISPNPTSSKITVKASLVLIGEEFTIYDQLGKAVKSGIITAEETEIDLSNLSEGVYLFKAGTEMQETFKIIKQ
jgi:hypothetical protein